MMRAPEPLARSFRVRLEMRTDWHVGTGAGRRGDVDRAVARDDDELPYVPARTVTGVWRDACEQVALALDGSSGEWNMLLDRVFGSQPALVSGPAAEAPRPAALSVRPARLNAWLRQRLEGAGDAELRAALTFVKPGVRIDPRTGRAQDRHLRSDEMARAGAVLWSDCSLELEPELSVHATALLCAGAVLVDRLGGGRRRGSGRCELRIAGADHDAAIAWLAEAPAVPTLPAERGPDRTKESPASQGVPGGLSAGEGWHEIRLHVRLLSPAVFPRAVVGNMTQTFDYLPGRYLLPALTRLVDELGMDLRPDIGRGDVRMLNGLPRIGGRRGVPVPLCFHRSKDPALGGRLWNALEADSSDYPKRLRDAYIAETDGRAMLWAPERAARAHNAIDDIEQRAAGDAGVYTIESLPAGTELEARLRVRSGVMAALDAAARARGVGAWWSGLAGRHSLGRSSKDDYGLLEVEVVDSSEPVMPPVTLGAGGRLRALCRSDVVLRDELLRATPTADALGGELARLLRVDELLPISGGSHVRVSRLDSWQTPWGLPRPSLVALAAGSVVEFAPNRDIDLDRLRAVALAGVGERRAEGFGEVSFGDALLDRQIVEIVAAEVPRSPVVVPTPGPDEAERAYAGLIEESAWRSAIRSVAAARSAELVARLHWRAETPPRSQLGALRGAVRRMSAPGVGPGVQWLRRLRDVRNRRELWPDAALRELELLLNERDRVWELLDLGRGPVLGDPAGTVERLRNDLWNEALVTLIDECARRRTRAA